jgi:hypothetical protein
MATAKSIAGLLRPNFNALVFSKYPLSDYVASMWIALHLLLNTKMHSEFSLLVAFIPSSLIQSRVMPK